MLTKKDIENDIYKEIGSYVNNNDIIKHLVDKLTTVIADNNSKFEEYKQICETKESLYKQMIESYKAQIKYITSFNSLMTFNKTENNNDDKKIIIDE